MALVTNQFLKGFPKRNRSHYLSTVDVFTTVSNKKWENLEDTVLYLKMNRRDHNYQKCYLTQDEVENALPKFIEGARDSVRLKTAMSVLSELSDTELMKVLGSLLTRRAKVAKTGG